MSGQVKEYTLKNTEKTVSQIVSNSCLWERCLRYCFLHFFVVCLNFCHDLELPLQVEQPAKMLKRDRGCKGRCKETYI